MESFVSRLISPDIVMWAEETDSVPAWFAWSSNHLDDVGSPKEFLDRSTSLKALFDGAMLIASGPSYYPIELVNPSAEEVTDRPMVIDYHILVTLALNPSRLLIPKRTTASTITT